MINDNVNAIKTGMTLPQPSRTEQKLTADQQTLITDTLSQFDAENLTEKDALSIVEAFAQAGIQPSAALEKAISTLGFDAKSIGDLAGVPESEHRPPPPPKQSTEEITSMVGFLTELLKEKLAASNSDNLSEEDKQSILSQVFERFDIEESDTIINTSA